MTMALDKTCYVPLNNLFKQFCFIAFIRSLSISIPFDMAMQHLYVLVIVLEVSGNRARQHDTRNCEGVIARFRLAIDLQPGLKASPQFA